MASHSGRRRTFGEMELAGLSYCMGQPTFRTATDFWGNGTGRIVLLRGSAVLPRSATPNPVPSVSQVTPSNATTTSGNTWLTIVGSNFVPGSIATWNGTKFDPTIVSHV